LFEKIGALSRHVVNDRRVERRLRRDFDITVLDDCHHEVFRGRSLDISSTGVRIRGFPIGTGIRGDQAVTVEFLIVPKELDQTSRRVPVPARVVRLDEKGDDFVVAIRFNYRVRV
jgi:c-di-GMP-binding flagellar brake protein YcgR